MKRAALFIVLLVFVVLGTGFLVLIWLNMRASRGGGSTQRSPEEAPKHEQRRGDGRSQESPRDREGGRNREETCSGLGVRCFSQYFAEWSWPADGSCQTMLRAGYPEPDAHCTPGGVVPEVTAETLRDPGWRTRCIRDCQSSEVQKRATYAWYGLARPEENSGENQGCELDHLVPLELGGADGMGNIWPECGPADVTLRERYFKQKDLVENYLAAKVRAGKMPLGEAQRGIATDWVQYLELARAHCRGQRCEAKE